MSVLEIMETLFLGPLKLVFEIIFSLALKYVNHPGLAIVALSLGMNILVLPLYSQADAIQEKARDTENRLKEGIDHIKKSFSGDERMMILQTYYRQNHYSPLSALNGSVPLLLEVPFFMAAYQFLSNLDALVGVSAGPIANLAAPDALLTIGSVSINVLPFVMTLINVISSALYLKGFPLKTKIQLYAMAAFFLVFLYDSPSGLLLYWTLNNVFSLVKNILNKLKNPKKVLSILSFCLGIGLLISLFALYHSAPLHQRLLIAMLSLALQLPLLLLVLRRSPRFTISSKPDTKTFFLGGLLLTILVGVLIPSAVIAASPQEFVNRDYFLHPLWYICSTASLAAGTFLVWFTVFYFLASPGFKVLFERGIWICCGVALVSYMFFGTDLGNLSTSMQYDHGLDFTWSEQLVNLAILAALTAVMVFISIRWKKILVPALLTVSIAMGGMSLLNFQTIHSAVAMLPPTQQEEESLDIQLSKTGKNVVVVMLDRAMGEYVPYIMKELPELEEQFAGFTYYSNTISFGSHTNFGSPALFGGYEYTPVEMNKRSDELLVTKHNEALKVMPVLFNENGYDVTICEQPYTNYQETSDYSIYDAYPEIRTSYRPSISSGEDVQQDIIQQKRRSIFCFSLMKVLPLFIQEPLYDGGQYLSASGDPLLQVITSPSTAYGINSTFLENYTFLDNLPDITSLTDSGKNTFLLMSNDTTHSPNLLQAPDYTPSYYVDNTIYDQENQDRFVVDGRILKMELLHHWSSYHANAATLLKLGQWMDHLRELGVYDNTRIILVSDHGFPSGQFDEWPTSISPDDYSEMRGKEAYFPLLMVKDFDTHTFETSSQFMTNADVPTLATKDIIENPTNPFTGKLITNDEKTAHDQFIIQSNLYNIWLNNGNCYLPSQWASVKDDIWNDDNWTFYEETVILTEHTAP